MGLIERLVAERLQARDSGAWHPDELGRCERCGLSFGMHPDGLCGRSPELAAVGAPVQFVLFPTARTYADGEGL